MNCGSFKVFIFTILMVVYFPISSYGNISLNLNEQLVSLTFNKSHVETVSFMFYKSANVVDRAKRNLQITLRNFLENLQKNLTTSTVLKALNSDTNLKRSQQKWKQLNDHVEFFETASHDLEEFSLRSEFFLEVIKNETVSILTKLRRVPTGHRILPPNVKLQLTTYFAEMEFFNSLFLEIIDEGMEYIINTSRMIQTTFDVYADIQRNVLHSWNFGVDNWCFNQYFEFLQKWSTLIYNCATNSRLEMVYNVYAMTETVIKHVMRQLEFKMQRLFNCFLLNGYNVKCSFLRYTESDFEELYTSLKGLQTYYDIKINRGRVGLKILGRNGDPLSSNEKEYYDVLNLKCIPYGFPEGQMFKSLKACFNMKKK